MIDENAQGNSLAIRRIAIDDAVAVAHLVGSLFEELHDGEPVPEYRLGSVETVLRDTARSFGFVACDDERPIGIVLLTEGVAIFAGGVFGQITELYVAPQYRSRGVASQLLRAVRSLGRERGWKRMDVGAPHQPRWSRSLHFYESEGFVEVGPRLRFDL